MSCGGDVLDTVASTKISSWRDWVEGAGGVISFSLVRGGSADHRGGSADHRGEMAYMYCDKVIMEWQSGTCNHVHI